MPKPMHMTIMVEEIAFGRVFRLIDAMQGVVSIEIAGLGPKIDGAYAATSKKERKDKPDKKPVSARAGEPSEIIILRALHGSPKLQRLALQALLMEGGKKAVTLDGAIHKLTKDKYAISVGDGFYSITPQGRIRLQERMSKKEAV